MKPPINGTNKEDVMIQMIELCMDTVTVMATPCRGLTKQEQVKN